MLNNKYQIVNDGHVAQRELNGVAGDTGPVTLDVAVNALLGDAEDATREVEKNHEDAPALGRAVAVVEEHLWSVLNERDYKLDVRDGVNYVQPHP